MTSAFSWQNSWQDFILSSNAKFVCYSRCFLTSDFCIPVPYNEKEIFLGCSLKKVLQVLEPFNFSFFSVTGRGIFLDYRDIEWFALETNRNHSVFFFFFFQVWIFIFTKRQQCLPTYKYLQNPTDSPIQNLGFCFLFFHFSTQLGIWKH